MESEKPEQPKKPFGRSLSDFGVLKPGERKLLEACRVGQLAILSNSVPWPLPLLAPVQALGPVLTPLREERVPITETNCVRADFLRFLLLGGDEQAPVHEHGVMLHGAYVVGELMLRSCSIPASVLLKRCFLPAQISAEDARVSGVFGLTGSHLVEGLAADRLKCTASIFLRDGFRVEGQVRLLGAEIGGNLDCSGGHFELKSIYAFSADRVSVTGSVHLREGFTAKGEVRLLGAQIGSNLDCSGGFFEFSGGHVLSVDGANVAGTVHLNKGFAAKGKVRLQGVQIGGDLDCIDGHFQLGKSDALSLRGAVVRGHWHLCGLSQSVRVDASHADVGVLIDELKAWAKGSTLDGLRYGALGGVAPTDGEGRVKWLHEQSEAHLNVEEFRPQPWRQMQRVLREMGHTEDAKQVGIAYEKHQRKIGRVGQSAEGKNFIAAWWRRVTSRTAHFIFGMLAGYGYRPMRLVTWMLAVWLACGAAYWHLSLAPYRAIAPSAPLIFQDANYINCQPDQPGPPQPPANWYLCDELRSEYATFSPLAYSLDLMLPVVDLGQEKAWGAFIPAANAVWWKELFTHWAPGHVVRLITWFQILFGWVSSLLLVAIISGFSRRNDES